jgi:hypothetical protein
LINAVPTAKVALERAHLAIVRDKLMHRFRAFVEASAMNLFAL